MDAKYIISRLKASLDPARFNHSLRVRSKALHLSRFHDVDPEKAALAGLLHDCSRYMDRPQMLRFAKKIHLKIDAISKLEPKLLHAELSAYIAREKYGVRDPQVLRAIASHTLGRKNMSMLEKIVYVSDHVEEGRSHAWVKNARKLAERDMDKAVVAISTSMIKYLMDKGLPVHPRSFEVRNHYILKNEQQ